MASAWTVGAAWLVWAALLRLVGGAAGFTQAIRGRFSIRSLVTCLVLACILREFGLVDRATSTPPQGAEAVVSGARAATCVLPKSADSITRAALLQQCVSPHFGGNETRCYDELGCFPMDPPWTSTLRPFPSPLPPRQIDVTLYLYTRDAMEGHRVALWPSINLTGSDFRAERERTVFVTHGFASNGNSSWLGRVKDLYLARSEANVFVVDWGRGAELYNYLQVASNTRVVGAELSRFGIYLMEELKLDAERLHLIGHSLGAHVSAYMAKNMAAASHPKPGRLTGLDPAGPGFELQDPLVRLEAGDAVFVDVIHSDAKPLVPFLGFGLLMPAGAVDIYLNGGTNQPGCYTNLSHHAANVRTISDLKSLPVEVLSQMVSCNHGRAYEVFASSLYPHVKCLWAVKTSEIVNLARVAAQGALNPVLQPAAQDVGECEPETCTAPGFQTPLLRARGVFLLSTTALSPFCEADSGRDAGLYSRLTSGVGSLATSIKDRVYDTAGRVYSGLSDLFG